MVMTNNLHNPTPPGPKGADFLTRMDAESAEIGRQFRAGAINGKEAARRLNALGGDGWWTEGSGGLLRWDLDGHPLGPVCWRCRDRQVINEAGGIPARCPSCPVGNDLAAIIAIRREAMKIREQSSMDVEVPPPSVHQLQTELTDLRAKLKHATAIAPDGFRLVEGFVSATKGRETPNQTDRMAYIDGVKGYRVTDAMSGPHGFIITAPVGVAFSGVVHILERDPSRKYQPWPEKLTFSVNA